MRFSSHCPLFSVLTVALFACNDAPPNEPPPLTEVNNIEVTEQPIDGAPAGHKLRAKRLDSQGHRTIEHFDGATWAPFMTATDPLIPLNMEALYRNGTTIVCAQATDQTATLDGIRVACAVRADGAAAFAERGTVEGEPNAWLHDVCVGQNPGDFKLLVSSAATPVPATKNDLAELTSMPCGSLTWTGSTWVGQPNTACMCDQLDGSPCDDPCYAGQGTWRNGSCDTSALAFKCNDGNATTADYCTGDPAALCVNEPE